MRKLTASLLVLCLVLTVVWALPVFGENEDDLGNFQKARGGTRTTLYVGPGQTYTTIQDAINDATVGNTIRVYAGTYNEYVNVNKRIELIGNGTGNTRIVGGGAQDVVYITADNVNVTGFTITNTGPLGSDAGINIYYSVNCRIENCHLSYNFYGIYIVQSSGNTINNTVNSNGYYGIYIRDTTDTTLTNNTCNSNNGSGIHLDESSSNILENNTCNLNLYYGITLDDSYSNTISNNICNLNNYQCISLSSSPSNTLVNNSMVGGGIWIEGYSLIYWNSHEIPTSNNVNGKPVYYWRDVTGGDVPSGAGQVILANCENVKVESQIISDVFVGILLGFSTNNEIGNNNCSNIQYGIYLRGSSNNTLANNTCNSNNRYGIYLGSSHNNSLDNNICNSNNDSGILLDYSANNTLEYNICNSNDGSGIFLFFSNWSKLNNNICNLNHMDGIHLYYNSDSNTLIKNTCNSNNRHGFYLDGSSNITLTKNVCTLNKQYGIYLQSVTVSTLENNKCNSNDQHGIYLYSASDNSLENNTCNLNNQCAIYLSSSESNTMINNIMDSGGIWIEGDSLSYWNSHNIDTSNKVNEKPVYYWKDVTSGNIPTGAGQVILVNCDKVKMESQNSGVILAFSTDNHILNNICSNNHCGIYLMESSENILENNTCSKNYYGIYLSGSDENSINDNIVTSSIDYSIYLEDSDNNLVYNNYFDNDAQAYDDSSEQLNNQWNQPKPDGGNYWSNWTSPDNDANGFVDEPYSIDGPANAKDFLPLVLPPGHPPKIITENIPVAIVNRSYHVNYSATDPDTPDYELTWTMKTNALWLGFSPNQELFGTPTSSDIGSYWVNITVSDEYRNDFTNFSLMVFEKTPPPNKPPKIITENLLTTYVGKLYSVKYSATDLDTPLMNLTWTMRTNASWLNFSSSQQLYGTPETSVDRSYWVNISVSDGNNGDFTNFTLTVLIKFPPQITTTDNLTAYVGQLYSVNYTATDPDTQQNNLSWSMNTNGSWLDFSLNQELYGTPLDSDAGWCWVYIEVYDGSNKDFTNFTITVFSYELPNITKPEIITTFPNYNTTNVMVNDTQIIVTFSKPMNRSSVEENLSIFPKAGYTLVWNDNSTELRIIFNRSLAYNTSYNISIGKTAKDMFGNRLESPFELVFITQKEPIPGDKPEKPDFILSGLMIGLVILIIIIITFAFITKSRRKKSEKITQEGIEDQHRVEFSGGNITDEYPLPEGAEYVIIKDLVNKARTPKKPTDFGPSQEQTLRKAQKKYSKGEISKDTFSSIKEILREQKQ